MHVLERLSIAVRHYRHVERLDWLWDAVRPVYDRMIDVTCKTGIRRNINGMDSILLAPRFRAVTEVYELEVWRRLMEELEPGDVFADVGAYLGLYTVAAARRVGPAGRVHTFEPDIENYQATHEHLRLNGLQSRVELLQAAVGARCERVSFRGAPDSGHVASDSDT
ncbi:MAG TPA: FkbM family methyltransferase, partial [Nitrospiraceae bacterium]